MAMFAARTPPRLPKILTHPCISSITKIQFSPSQEPSFSFPITMYHVPTLHSLHFLSDSPHLLATYFSNCLNIPITSSLEQSQENKLIYSRLLHANKTRIVISSKMQSVKDIESVRTCGNEQVQMYPEDERLENLDTMSLFHKQTMLDYQHMIRLHDTHVRSVTFQIKSRDAMHQLYQRAIDHGATGLGITDHDALIKVPYSDILHYFVLREDEFERQFEALSGKKQKRTNADAQHVNFIDHLAIAVEKDQAEQVSQWYIDALDFERFYVNDDDERDHGLIIQGLRTLVVCPKLETEHEMQNAFKLVFVEPVRQVDGKKSQIQEFLDYHGGMGVAHLAFNTADILADVARASQYGMDFVSVPHTYYDLWKEKEGYDKVLEDWERIKDLSIMVDGNANGRAAESDSTQNGSNSFNYLLQTFTHPLGTRPTFYIELICRRGSTGFGKGNIKQLFDAIAMLQKLRGNEWE